MATRTKSKKSLRKRSSKVNFDLLGGYDPYRDAGDEYCYNHEKADAVIRFFKNELTLTKGRRFKGKPFEPFPWAEQLLRCLFGWRRKSDGGRRYRTVFLYVGRKNAKSELVAGIANYIFFTDDELDNEIYIAARDRDQASTLYNMTKVMMEQNEKLERYVDFYITTRTTEMCEDGDNTKMKVVSSDGASAHSLSPGLVIVDELHAQRNNLLIEGLTTGMGARDEPLTIFVTTADYEGETICNTELEYAESIRDGKCEIPNPTYLPVVFRYNPQKDKRSWEDIEVWKEVNPSYPVTPNHEFLMDWYRKAKVNKKDEISFRRLFLNEQVGNVHAWLDMTSWMKCKEDFDKDELLGEECYAAVDLASKHDIGALVLYFPAANRLLCKFYIPVRALQIRYNKKNYDTYQKWVDEKYMTVCGRVRHNYDRIVEDITEIDENYDLICVGVDPWNAQQFANKVEDEDIDVVEFRQNMRYMNEPSKIFSAMIEEGDLRHNNPVLDWMAQNTCIEIDKQENIRPVKETPDSTLKIDGIVSSIMAIGCSLMGGNETRYSVYNERGILSLNMDENGNEE